MKPHRGNEGKDFHLLKVHLFEGMRPAGQDCSCRIGNTGQAMSSAIDLWVFLDTLFLPVQTDP